MSVLSLVYITNNETMDVIIKSLDFTAGEKLEEYIREKLQKLDKMNDSIIRARVTLQKGQSIDESHLCDIRLEIPGNDHFVQKGAKSFEGATLDAIDTLQTIIRRSK